MRGEPTGALDKARRWIVVSVLLFWVGYVVISFVVGFATASTIGSEVARLVPRHLGIPKVLIERKVLCQQDVRRQAQTVGPTVASHLLGMPHETAPYALPLTGGVHGNV